MNFAIFKESIIVKLKQSQSLIQVINEWTKELQVIYLNYYFMICFFFVVKATLLPSSSVQQPASLSSHIRGDFLEIIVRLVN